MNKIDLECGCELKGSVEFYCEIHDSFICIPCKIQAHLGCTFHISSISFSEMAKPLLEDLIHCVDVIKSVWKNIPTHNRCEDEYDYIDIAQETISQFRSEYEAHEKLISKLMLSKDNSFRYKREMILLSKQMMIFKTNLMESEIWKSTTNYMIQRTNKDTKCLIQPSELNNSHLKDRKKIIKKFEKKIEEQSKEISEKDKIIIDLSYQNDMYQNEITALKLNFDEIKSGNDLKAEEELKSLKKQLQDEKVKNEQLNDALVKLINQNNKPNKDNEEQKKDNKDNKDVKDINQLVKDLLLIKLLKDNLEERKDSNNPEANAKQLKEICGNESVRVKSDEIKLIIDVEEKSDEIFTQLEKYKLPPLRTLTIKLDASDKIEAKVTKFIKECIYNKIDTFEILGSDQKEIQFSSIAFCIKYLSELVQDEIRFKNFMFENKDIEFVLTNFSKLSTINLSENRFGKISQDYEINIDAEFNLEYIWFNKTKNFDLAQLEILFTKFSPFISHCLRGIEVNGTGIDSSKAEKILKSQGYKADVEDDSPEIN